MHLYRKNFNMPEAASVYRIPLRMLDLHKTLSFQTNRVTVIFSLILHLLGKGTLEISIMCRLRRTQESRS